MQRDQDQAWEELVLAFPRWKVAEILSLGDKYGRESLGFDWNDKGEIRRILAAQAKERKKAAMTAFMKSTTLFTKERK